MKYTEITSNGEVKKGHKNNEKLAYGSMLNLRVILCSTFNFNAISSAILAY
jgi:hypothetical protein